MSYQIRDLTDGIKIANDNFKMGYETALKDLQEKIDNANCNFYSEKGLAPWSWNYEIEDLIQEMLNELKRVN